MCKAVRPFQMFPSGLPFTSGGLLVPMNAVHLHFTGCVRPDGSAVGLFRILCALLSERRRKLNELGLYISQNIMQSRTLAQLFHVVLSRVVRDRGSPLISGAKSCNPSDVGHLFVACACSMLPLFGKLCLRSSVFRMSLGRNTSDRPRACRQPYGIAKSEYVWRSGYVAPPSVSSLTIQSAIP